MQIYEQSPSRTTSRPPRELLTRIFCAGTQLISHYTNTMQRTIFFSMLGLLLVTPWLANAQTAPVNPDEELLHHRDATAAALVRLISSHLDKTKDDAWKASPNTPYGSWEVTYQPQYNLIQVQREDEVLITHEPMLNDSPEPHAPTLGPPNFLLSVEPFISPEEYARLKAENATINGQLSHMAVGMKDIRHKFDSYLPKNDQEKQKVAAYNKLKASLHDLPDFYFRDISLSWWVLGLGESFVFHQPGEIPAAFKPNARQKGWEYERATTVQAILPLLSRYEPEPQ